MGIFIGQLFLLFIDGDLKQKKIVLITDSCGQTERRLV